MNLATARWEPHAGYDLSEDRQLEAVQLGHTKIESTVRYLGIEVDETRAQASLIGSLTRKVAPPLTFSALIVPS